jgi:hypothetical protein
LHASLWARSRLCQEAALGESREEHQLPRELPSNVERLRTRHRFIKNFSLVPDWDSAA